MIDKSVAQAPGTLDSIDGLAQVLLGNQPSMTNQEVEDDLEEASVTELEDGSVEVDLSGGMESVAEEVAGMSLDHNENLAEILAEVDADYLTTLADDLLQDVEDDLESRKDWEQAFVNGLKLLGLRYEKRTEPWTDACGAFTSLITEAVVRFQAETIMETFPASGPVKTQIIGKKSTAKEAAAQRVKEDMNNELCNVMVEYRDEHEKMLWNLPIAGSAFKKVYEDPTLGRGTSRFVGAEDLILPYGASDLMTSPRVTQRMRMTENELRKFQKAKFYRDCELTGAVSEKSDIEEQKDKETGFEGLDDPRYTVFEIHVDYDLKYFEDTDKDGEKTGIALPYVITVCRDLRTIIGIRRNWVEGDPLKLKRNYFVHYKYVPGFGPYGFGLLHLIGSSAEAATSLLRQLVDAGTLSNLPGGFKTKGMRITGGDVPVKPGEFKDVDVASGTLKENIVPLPYKEPSATLMALMNQISDDARRFAATADMKISDMSATAPVGTTLAILERSLKVMSAVQARVHASLKIEFKLLAAIIRDQLAEKPSYDYDVDSEEGPRVKSEDYQNVEIIPVSDPNASTMSQRVVQYQAAMQMAEKAPQIYNQPYLHRQMLEVIGIKNAEKLVPLPEDARPQDPVTENMSILRSKPLKAFAYQDHAAHIAVHQAFMQDPQIAALLGQNPQAQMMMAALNAHMAEHAAFQYRAQIEQSLGVPLPHIDDDESAPVNPEDEKPLSALIAQAAQRVLTMNQAQAAMAQNQQAAMNPELQLQQEELRLKEAEMQRKAINDKFDYDLGRERLAVDRERMKAEATIKAAKVVSDARNKGADRAARRQDSVMRALKPVNNFNKPNKE